jgi:hypothetical protein
MLDRIRQTPTAGRASLHVGPLDEFRVSVTFPLYVTLHFPYFVFVFALIG